MSEKKELIDFKQSLPIISQSLRALNFSFRAASLSNIYRVFEDFVRKQFEELTPVSFVTFTGWFIDKPYFFKFANDGTLLEVYNNLSANPKYEQIKKFIHFYVLWKVDADHNQKESLGIVFPEDDELNNQEKLQEFAKLLNLEVGFEFYDLLDGEHVLNKILYPFLPVDRLDKLEEAINSSWKLYGSVPEIAVEFWQLIKKHIQDYKEKEKNEPLLQDKGQNKS